ncbi:hypothetical protein IWW36_006246, partial [Coemansia brasiliensis]
TMSSIKEFLKPDDAKPEEALKHIKNSKIAVIDFTATWCGPCKLMKPKFKAFSEKYKNVQFIMVDVDEFSSIAAEYNVNAMPTFKFTKNGEVVDEIVGANATGLEEKLKKFEEEAKPAEEEEAKEEKAEN